jgi:lysozyme
MNRLVIASLSLSAAGLVGIANWEGFRDEAYIPVPGDKPTIGFGTTEGVKAGDSITVERALVRLLADANKFEQAVKRCAPVPMFTHEFTAYVSLAYNIGESAFCSSTLAKKLNALDYEGACKEILRWNKFQGRVMQGLVNRREHEYKMCIGEKP